MLRALGGAKDRKAKKQRDELMVTLSFANAKIQSLRFQLQQLNAKVHECVRKSTLFHTHAALAGAITVADEVADADDDTPLPLIVLGLKETAHVDLKGPLARFIESHYHEKTVPSDCLWVQLRARAYRAVAVDTANTLRSAGHSRPSLAMSPSSSNGQSESVRIPGHGWGFHSDGPS